MKIKIYSHYGKIFYFGGLMFILTGGFIAYDSFKFLKNGDWVSLIIAIGVIIFGITIFFKAGKEYTQVIECERYEELK